MDVVDVADVVDVVDAIDMVVLVNVVVVVLVELFTLALALEFVIVPVVILVVVNGWGKCASNMKRTCTR